ncbi:unnamed protein product [Cyclocybe aegerita]|uniref:Uncharacterized protein n=1 Tax=Cyclocybe aegerita TaxID=1973307 RepID=A0A8S0W8F4_CYCAE|nr:unnamed protein product [Cyclocybe aegerita]
MYRVAPGYQDPSRAAAPPINAPILRTIDLPPVDGDYNDAEVLRFAMQGSGTPSVPHLLLSNASVAHAPSRHAPVASLDAQMGRLSISAVQTPASDPSLGRLAASGGARAPPQPPRQGSRRTSPTPQLHARRHPSSHRAG